MKKLDKYKIPGRAVSLFGAHCCAVLICVIICLGFSPLMTKTVGIIITQVIALIVYCFPIYSTMWNQGHTDLNRAKFGHIKPDKFMGFKIGAAASIPLLIISLLFILSKFGLFYNFVVPYKLINGEVWPLLNLIHLAIYLPDFTWWQTALYAILPFIIIPIAGFSYTLGNKDFAPIQRLVYKNSKKNKK